VVATDHPGNTFLDSDPLDRATIANLRPGQVVASVDALLERTQDPNHFLGGLTQGDSYVMTGHSFGAWTTLAVAGGLVDYEALVLFCELEPEWEFCSLSDEVLLVPGSPDPRATHALSMAPGGWYAFGELGLQSVKPAMVWGGTLDEMTDYYDEIRPSYEGLGVHKELWTLEGAGHFVYSDLCRVAPFISDECFDDRGFIDLATGQEIVRTVTTSWLRRQVAGDERDQSWWDEQPLDWPEITVETD
jgi:predicted dienelactone hydrolase